MAPASQPDQKALEQVVEHALALAKQGGATAAEAGVGVSTGPVGHGAPRRSGDPRIPARPEPRRHRVCGTAQGIRQHREPDARGGRGNGPQGAAPSRASRPTTHTPGLPEAELMAGDLPDLDLSHPWDLEAPAAAELARRCEAAGLAHDPRITNSEGARSSTHRKLRVFGNSLGFMGGYPSTRHSVSCAVIAAGRRRDAARLLVQRPRVPRSSSDPDEVGRPQRRRAHRRAPRRAARSATAPGAGAVRPDRSRAA